MISRKQTVAALVAALALSIVPASGLLSPASGAATVGTRASATAPPRTFVGIRANRLAVFRSSTGAFIRYLTSQPPLIGFPSVRPNRAHVLFVQTTTTDGCPATYSIPLAGGTPTRVRGGQYGGSFPIAAGPHGALAGLTDCIATEYLHATAANGRSYNINGVRQLGVSGLSWGPDGYWLAAGTFYGGVRYLDVRKTAGLTVAKTVPCPSAVRSCSTTAPAYSPSGTLYYVVANKPGTRAYVVRLAHGVARIVFRLPRASAHYSLAVASGGNILVSGDANTGTETHSDFIVRWDGAHTHALKTSAVQVDW